MAANEKRFSFVSLGIPGDIFGVVRFSGTEGLSKIYEFDIQLVSADMELDLNEIIQNPARLTFLREEGNICFNGIVSEFEQLHQVGDMCFYSARLVPRVWWLTQTPFNQVFLDKSVPEIIGQVFRSGGLMNDDFDIRLEGTYPKWEYVCQYRETHMHFVRRLMEREGIYYYFEQTGSGEKLIITDTRMAHTYMAEGRSIYYSPPSGLDTLYREEVIKNFFCRQKMVPKSVHLRDHNFGRPELPLEGSADVFEEGHGQVYFYGDHFTSPEQAGRLTRIRAESYQCWMQTFYGDTTIPFLRPGYSFHLDNHFRAAFNQDYLTVEVSHQGNQASFMLAGLPGQLSEQETSPAYVNRVTALPASVQFRPERKTEKPRFYGTLNARIDAAGDGTYAELDAEGRYKVILPFDRSGRSGGKASAWIRMMQPYAGSNQGMHFPLHKGTEVLLTFIEGDPDRPVIAGAVPTPQAISPVNERNQTKSMIQTGRGNLLGGNNYIEFEDKNRHEAIRIHSPGDLWREAQNRYGEYHAYDPQDSLSDGREPKIEDLKSNFGPGSGCNPTGMIDIHNSHQPQANFFSDVFRKAHVHLSSLDTVNLQEGNIYDFGGYWNYNLGNCYVEEHLDQSPELNKEHDYDLLDAGGPNWNGWRTVKSEEHGGSTNQLIDLAHEASDGWKNIWVEKHFGDAYEYTEGSTISVTKGSSQEIQVGGRHVEEKYNGKGKKTLYSVSEKGKTEETKWCSHTGNMLSYSISQKQPNAVHSFDFNWANTMSMDMKFAASTSLDFTMAASTAFHFTMASSLAFDFKRAATLDLTVAKGLQTEIGSYTGGKIGLSSFKGLSLNAAMHQAAAIDLSSYQGLKLGLESFKGLSLSVETGLAIAIKCDLRTTAKIDIDNNDGKLSVKAGGLLEFAKETSLKAAVDTLRVRM
mgnify:FL=1